MKDLMKMYKEVLMDLWRAGITPGTVSSIEVSTRAKRTAGTCRRIQTDLCPTYKIRIAAFMLDDQVNDQTTKDTIAHELLHTCDGCFNHGPEWKRQASKLDEFGYSITRTTDVKKEHIQVPKAKYLFRCKGCGNVVGRVRKSDFTKYYWMYCCTRCKSGFEKIKEAV